MVKHWQTKSVWFFAWRQNHENGEVWNLGPETSIMDRYIQPCPGTRKLSENLWGSSRLTDRILVFRITENENLRHLKCISCFLHYCITLDQMARFINFFMHIDINEPANEILAMYCSSKQKSKTLFKFRKVFPDCLKIAWIERFQPKKKVLLPSANKIVGFLYQ